MKRALFGASTSLLAVGLAIASAAPALGQATSQPPVSPSTPPATDSVPPQETPTNADAQVGRPSDQSIGDIIVTARRRDESLSKTPVSVAVLTADNLVKAQVTSEADLRSITPGLAVRASQNSNQLNYAIRGQSQDAYSNTRPGVLPYLNEVQIGGAGGSSAFYDLQSIQVLKGPQGTLFGRSATGGAVLFTSAKPTDAFGGYLSASGGDYSAFKVEGAINAPIIDDRLMARVSGVYQSRDGYQTNLYDSSHPGKVNRYGVRGSLTAKLSDTITNDFVIDYYHADNTNTIASISGLLPFTGTPPPFIPITFLYGGTATPTSRAIGIGTVQAFLAAAGPGVQGLVPAFYDAYFANPRHPAGGIQNYLATQQARGPYVVSSDAANFYKANNVIVTNSTGFKIGDNALVKNIFGYTYLKSSLGLDADGTPYGISAAPNALTTTRQISEELQLQGTTFGDRLTYTLGGYFSDEKNTTLQQSAFFDILLGGQSQNNDFVIKNRTYAGYAQITYKLNDSGLSATVGGRYTSERVSKTLLSSDANYVNPPPAGQSNFRQDTFNKVSWTLGLQDQLSPTTLLYAASRRAYKSGGFNGLRPGVIGFGETGGDEYRAEQVTDGELGAKFNGRVGGLPARLNIAGFYTWDKNRQTTAYAIINLSPAAITVNVPEAQLYGVEFDGSVNPIGWLTLGVVANYTHSRFSNGTVNALGVPQTYDRLPDTPEYSGSIYADVSVPVAHGFNLLVHGDAYAQAKFFTTPNSTNFAGTTVPKYGLVNFRIGIDDVRDHLTLTANLKNAFNKVYYVGGVGAGELYQINTFVPGEPRMFTIELRKTF